jgi:cytochrome b561
MSPSSYRYTPVAISLHWLVATLIVCAFAIGSYMADLKFSPLKLQLFSYHKWLGVTVFLLVIIRLIWRAKNTPPGLPSTIAAWQQRAAHGLHHVLYVLMFAIPLSGWLMSSAKGVPTVYLGLIALPDLLDKDKALGHTLENIHVTLNYLMLALLVLHVAAALKHHFIERDNTLARMLPFLQRDTK